MIITKQKTLSDILRALDNSPVFLIGCNECATLCHTGGTDELLKMKETLEQRGISVSGYTVLEPACHLNNDKRLLKKYEKELGRSEKILVFACGNGAQTVAEIFPEKEVLTGTDTLFLGEITHVNEFDNRCILCGDCLIDTFGGLCPISRCPKSMLNGPCGGSSGGKCEVNKELECIWDRAYQELKKKGKIPGFIAIQKPKNWSKASEQKRRV
jgi:ferredoxin